MGIIRNLWLVSIWSGSGQLLVFGGRMNYYEQAVEKYGKEYVEDSIMRYHQKGDPLFGKLPEMHNRFGLAKYGETLNILYSRRSDAFNEVLARNSKDRKMNNGKHI